MNFVCMANTHATRLAAFPRSFYRLWSRGRRRWVADWCHRCDLSRRSEEIDVYMITSLKFIQNLSDLGRSQIHALRNCLSISFILSYDRFLTRKDTSRIWIHFRGCDNTAESTPQTRWHSAASSVPGRQRWKRLSPLTRKTRKMTGTALITRLWVLFGLWHASFPSKDVYAARGCFNRVEETSRVTQLSLSSVTPTLSPRTIPKYHLSLPLLPRWATHFATPLVFIHLFLRQPRIHCETFVARA